jgi:hypothetical protein
MMYYYFHHFLFCSVELATTIGNINSFSTVFLLMCWVQDLKLDWRVSYSLNCYKTHLRFFSWSFQKYLII